MTRLTVQETPMFIRSIREFWTDEEREEFINWISINFILGDVMPGYGGLRKVRWRSLGKGKRSGTRVIYFNKLQEGKVVLLIAYQKSEFDNLSESFLKRLREEMMK
ncbi:MAG: transcriptional regulator [Pelistega sp.]|nr:transcriptional regulator [Pelistega sp.]